MIIIYKIHQESGYLIHKSANGTYSLSRILNQYDSKEEIRKDLVKVLTNNKSDEDMLDKYNEKI